MDITETIKNKYHKIKSSLKEALFSKNKSVANISYFGKQSLSKKIITSFRINLFFLVPFGFFFLSSVYSVLFVLSAFIVSNAIFWSSTHFIRYLIKKFRKTPPTENIVFGGTAEPSPIYFENTFIGKIKEFFMAAGSVTISFLPYMATMNILLLAVYISKYFFFGVNNTEVYQFLLVMMPYVYMLLISLSMIGIYTFKMSSSIHSILTKYLIKQKTETFIKMNNKQENAVKKSFPVEEFIPSLSNEFRNQHNVDFYKEEDLNKNHKKTMTVNQSPNIDKS